MEHIKPYIRQPQSDEDWADYHRIRIEEIFNTMDIVYDSNHPSITAPANHHFVLCVEDQIVGAAQLEILDNQRVALRPIAITARYQNQGLGSYFLTELEQWVQIRGYRRIQLHANPRAVPFYQRLGYVEAPFDEQRPITISVVDMKKEFTEPMA